PGGDGGRLPGACGARQVLLLRPKSIATTSADRRMAPPTCRATDRTRRFPMDGAPEAARYLGPLAAPAAGSIGVVGGNGARGSGPRAAPTCDSTGPPPSLQAQTHLPPPAECRSVGCRIPS